MQAGMAVGRRAQATTLGVISPAQRRIWKGAIRVGRVPFVTLGWEGLQLARAYREYGLGRISQREFYRRRAESVVTGTFTAGGAAVGAIVGFVGNAAGFSLDVTQVASVGASIGALAAEFAADPLLNWYHREGEFDEQQRQAVNAAVEKFYGLETRNQVVQH